MPKCIHTTVQGIVIPDVWDERGNVVSVALFTYQEEKIRIINDGRGEVLQHHLREQVQVEGEVDSAARPTTIRVHRYWIKSEPPESVD